MKRNLVIPFVSAAAALLFLSACGAESAETTAPAGVAVQTRVVEVGDIASDSTVSGAVAAEDESTVMVAVTARCLDTYAEAGDAVTEGQVLCRLELDSTLSNYNAAKLAYASAQQSYNDQAAMFGAQIAAASQSVTFYEKMLTDTQALFAIGAASQLEVDQAALQLTSARSQLQSAIASRNSTLSQLESGIQSALSTVQQLESALENIDDEGNVTAPISGTLVSMNAVKGGYVTSSAPVAVINGSGKMEIRVSVSETLIGKLRAGDMADVSVAALGRDFTALIRSVEQTASMQTRLYTVTLDVPETVPGLLSGMFASVTFHTDPVKDAVVIPSEAILTNGEIRYVYVVEDGAARYVEITAGMTGDGVTVVTSGLEAGMELVTVGQSYLSDGAAVRVVGEG